MLSQTAEHALRALLYLARHAAGPVPAEVVAEGIGAPRNYLGKTLHALVKRGIVSAVRGPHGGFELVVAPSALTVARVISAIDGPPPGRTRCLLGDRACDAERPCRAHLRWTELCRESQAPLRRTTLADLMGRAEEAVTEFVTEATQQPRPTRGDR